MLKENLLRGSQPGRCKEDGVPAPAPCCWLLLHREFQLSTEGFLNSVAPSGGLKENAWLHSAHTAAGVTNGSFSNQLYQQQLEVTP